jgi:hypothetical protein
VNAWSHPRRTGLLAAVLARAEAWLLEPPSAGGAPQAPTPPPRPVVVVRGLARGCGASSIARALAASLARGDPCGVAVVVGGPPGGGPRIAAPPAVRMARTLAATGCEATRASGRVCLVADEGPLALAVERADAPVVVDVAHTSPPAEGLGHADVVVLVGSPAVEESLIDAVEASLASAGHMVEIVVNRVAPDDLPRSAAPGRLLVGESRLAAQLALTCREPRGPFATPIAELAERCRAAAP